MKTDTIVQFECFETKESLDEFILQWEYYAKKFSNLGIEVTLQQQTLVKNRFKYVSQHSWPEENFQFDFMKGRHSGVFPEGGVKVVQAGGYAAVQFECNHDTFTDDIKVMLFVHNAETDLQLYRSLKSYRYLNIYESYYESCLYAYIIEFFVEKNNITHFIELLETNGCGGVEHGLYRECFVLNK
ncbi:MAG: hypothetical protein ABI861_07545 [Panacibacter sp.]